MSFRTGFLARGGMTLGALSVSHGLGGVSSTPFPPLAPVAVTLDLSVPPPAVQVSVQAQGARQQIIVGGQLRSKTVEEETLPEVRLAPAAVPAYPRACPAAASISRKRRAWRSSGMGQTFP